jgi:uncharacterized protein (DUF2336 family)
MPRPSATANTFICVSFSIAGGWIHVRREFRRAVRLVNGALTLRGENGLIVTGLLGRAPSEDDLALAEKGKLTGEDVARLMTSPTPENRADAAAKIATVHGAGDLGPRERAIAEDIFRRLLNDTASGVRVALADALKENADAPHDVIRTLAADIDAVALPIIRVSPVLTEGDLLEIVAIGNETRQTAIASRPVVSETVSAALAETDRPGVVSTLMSNAGARIADETFGRVLDVLGDNQAVSAAMALRSQLPVTAVERLVHLVSEELRQHLVTHHEMSADLAADLVIETRERALLALVGLDAERTDVDELVAQLDANGRLTPTLMLRALCLGDLVFFETALARRARIPVLNAYQLIHDAGGLVALCHEAGLPERMLPVVEAAVEIISEATGSLDEDRARLRARVAERVLTHCETAFDGEPIDYLITRLGQAPAAPSAVV